MGAYFRWFTYIRRKNYVIVFTKQRISEDKLKSVADTLLEEYHGRVFHNELVYTGNYPRYYYSGWLYVHKFSTKKPITEVSKPPETEVKVIKNDTIKDLVSKLKALTGAEVTLHFK